ncbi:hypothetical protein Xcel_0381 [Xylanimonas cellulosilytica DSM 15894]|uniref:ABC3 transporter permease protein domain-containing protein n=1 Tax=Xylanimonas cellulosilytica (strain DSM 15894 / JCM 12276 / CECT 5975 / KCTC 9989 / LMG 20990 / NBRC 107835 / XIL07) TaxID=446471 RepID=D1BVE9_XYLCX|nr:ABC transporter permease [Xylanimonas cellulosilytica]ACZ29420.1 hypothetical protein Xcel_0381 [Xylanimonas cellulosilytica DSM 15894]
MTALLALGLRLARAGGPLRAWSIALGNAVGVVLLLVATAVPVAMYPRLEDRLLNLPGILAIVIFLLVPGAVLLVMVGRLSSGLRDRRLAALRVIGLSPLRTRVVAAVENGVLALAGAIVGAALYAVAAPVSGTALVGAGAVAQPLAVTPVALVATVAVVALVSAGAATSSTWNSTMPGQTRSEARPTTPRPWRLAVLVAGLAPLAWLGSVDASVKDPGLVTALLLGGTAVTGVGIALVTPLGASWASRLLVRSDGVTTRLAGRAIQTDSASAGRVVAGFGVAVFLSTGALGVLGAFETTPQYVDAIRSYGPGPQKVFVGTMDGEAPIPEEDVAALLALPGVHGIAPAWVDASYLECGTDMPCGSVLVGTCAQLELAFAMTGCDDSRASIITPVGEAVGNSLFSAPGPGPGLVVGDPLTLFDNDGNAVQTLTLDGAAVIEDWPRQLREWVWPSNALAFVPVAMLDDWYGGPVSVKAVADGGAAVSARIEDWAAERGLAAYQPADHDYRQVQGMRAAVWGLCGIAVAVALIVFALGGVDRAQERRRSVARQAVVGVPGRVLLGSQLLQAVIPVLVAFALALGAGVVGVWGYSSIAGSTFLLTGTAWTGLILIAGLGGLLAALSTVPLARTRLTPELLRRE